MDQPVAADVMLVAHPSAAQGKRATFSGPDFLAAPLGCLSCTP